MKEAGEAAEPPSSLRLLIFTIGQQGKLGGSREKRGVRRPFHRSCGGAKIREIRNRKPSPRRGLGERCS
jgi:hypothetical protein